MSNKIKYFLVIITIGALIFPQAVFAFISPWDYVSAALSGIEEKFGPIADKIILILFMYAIGLTLLSTSAGLLDWVIGNPQWLTLQGSEMVRAGFYFTSGLANLFLILILIVIAFAHIFKLETFQTKKALPKLILVALLINFSLVFIGILIDVANILYNTILPEEGLLGQVIESLVGGGVGVVTTIVGMLIAFAISALVPFIHSLPIQVATLTLTGALLLPNIVTWVFQIVLFYLMTGIFFTYVFLFAARVFVIQILAILSPLAFLCLILPQTEKYWKDWLQHLIQWVSLGIGLLFFLVLGLKASALLAPPGGPTPLPMGGWFTGIEKYFIYYFFLFIYMLIVLWVSEKTMPILAASLISHATTWGMKAWTGILKPLGGATGQQIGRVAASQAAEEKALREREEAEAKAKGEKYQPSLSRRIKTGITTPVRWAYRAAGTTPELAVSKEIGEKAAKLEKKFGKDTKSAMESGLNPVFGWKGADPHTKAAMALYLQKQYGADKKGLGQLDEKQLIEVIKITAASIPHRVEDIVKHKPELIDDSEVGKLIQNTMVNKEVKQKPDGTFEFEDKDIEAMVRAGVKIEGEDIKELIKTDVGRIKVIREAAYKKAVDALKSEDIDALTSETLDNLKFQEMVVRFKPIAFTRRIGEEKGAVIDKLHQKAEELGAEEIIKTNAPLLRSAITNPGFKAVFPPIKGASSTEDVDVLRTLAKEPKLTDLYHLRKKTEEAQHKLDEERRKPPEERVSEEEMRKLEEALREAREETERYQSGEIEPDLNLKKKWEEIERLMGRPPRRRRRR